MNCQLCNAETEGSIGPASGYRRPICSPCAERVDGEVLQQAMAMSRRMERIFDEVLNVKPLQEMGLVDSGR